MDTKDLSQKIYNIVADEVDAIYPEFMRRVNDIDIDYFEDIVRDSEIIPKELNFELRDKILDDIKKFAIQLLEESNIKERIDALMKDADEATAKAALNDARKLIRDHVYARSILNGSSNITEEELQEMHKEAKKQDLWERITQNNKKDIIRFHHALMNNTYEQCKDILYESVDSFLFK